MQEREKFNQWTKNLVNLALYIKKHDIRNIVVIDYDGTLSDLTHRLPNLPTKDLHLTESWSEFSALAKFDAPIQNTIKVINGLIGGAGFFGLILTGRSDEFRNQSVEWLIDNSVEYDHMVMRCSEDNRKDTVIKEEVLRAIGLDRILCAFDDNPQVIEHFRKLGIQTYAVTGQQDESRDDLKSHGVTALKH